MQMTQKTGLEIAVIGMAGRFPGASDLDELWRNLCSAAEAIHFFSEEELLTAGVPAQDLASPGYVRACGMLGGIDLFDAGFFGYSPREAEIIDPQHRLFLECAWQTLEDAGYDPTREGVTVGVYAGASMNSYMVNVYSDRRLDDAVSSYQVMLGNDKDYLAPRLSYKLDLEGPSITVQTACSTSLVAVHVAVQALLNGECDMALAGGVTARAPETGYHYREGMILSPDGHCRAFAAGAQGTVGGNGVGVVALRRLEDALAAGDSIYAVIKGSAVNNDGFQKVGFTAPRIEGQAKVIRSAQLMAEVEARTITYVEGHGTGTPLGDPIEVAALTRAFRVTTDEKGFCALGSVKTNIGHLDVAAGVAGLIKTVLALHHRQIPPSLHFDAPNPQIDFAETPFYVNAELRDWPAGGSPRRAAVSSFGIGGTNAHVILEEAPEPEPSGASRSVQLLLLSAKTPTALESATANLALHLEREPRLTPASFADVAHTLRVGRKTFACRRAVVCRSAEEAAQALRMLDPRQVVTGSHEGGERRAVFLFPGQGAQHAGMASDLYRGEPFFREQVDHCAEILRPHLGLDLRQLFGPEPARTADVDRMLEETWLTQPALFVIEHSLAQLWREWGIRPASLIGHSLGEIVAACMAGVFSLEEALRLVAARGRLMQSLPLGAMLAVPLPEEEIVPLLGEALSLAAVNAPARCTVSGPVPAIEALELRLAERGLESRRLRTSRAFHSAAVEPVLKDWEQQVRSIALRPPEIPYLSNVTGDWIRPGEATDPGYWVRHLRSTVRFSAGCQKLWEPPWVFLEVGPGTTLRTLVRRHRGTAVEVCSSLSSPGEEPVRTDLEVLLGSLGRLWLAGLEADWQGLVRRERRRRVALPTYPFERQRYWIQSERPAAPQRALRKEPDPAAWFYVPSWTLSAPPAMGGFAGRSSTWLLFTDREGVGVRLAERLRQEAQEVIVVEMGEPFRGVSGDAATFDPRREEDYDTLVRALQRAGRLPRRIVHLWSVTRDDPRPPSSDLFEEIQLSGFYSVLSLTRALARQWAVSGVDLAVVSTGVQRVDGRESLRPEKATLLGLCNVLPQEYPDLACRSIDLSLPEPASQQDEGVRCAAAALLTELAGLADRCVAYRGRLRWLRTFQPLHLPAAPGSPGLRERGVYLLTGGLGRIGLALAEHLARQVRARLVLTSRASFPDRERWAEWLAHHDEDDATAQRIRRLLALEEAGVEILIASADVAHEESMRAVVARAVERFGCLHGVIHGAGIVGERTHRAVAETGPEEAGWSFRPKVHGLLVLEKVLRGIDLDFCLLLSSVSSVLGGLGFAAYAAANLFLDAFAERQHLSGATRFLSLAYEGWSWQEESSGRRRIGAGVADLALTPREGVEVFARALAMVGTPRLVVSTGDLAVRLAQWVRTEPVAGEPDESHPHLYARPHLANSYVAPGTETERAVAEIWQRLLGIDRIGLHDSFFDLGGDSLLVTRLAAGLRRHFEMDIPLRMLFAMPTIAAQVAAIAALQAEGATARAAAAPIVRRGKSILDQLMDLEQLSDQEVRSRLEGGTT